MDSDGRDYLADPRCREQFRKNVGAKYGFISLSSQMDNNVMWGHYADKFKGIVLEFETQQQAKIQPVTYQQTRYFLREGTSYRDGEHLELIARKGNEWAYEAEWRCFVDINSCRAVKNPSDKIIYLFPAEPHLALTGIILGPECHHTFMDIIPYVESMWTSRDIIVRRMVHDSLTFALRVSKELSFKALCNEVTSHNINLTYRTEIVPLTRTE
jgi:hypothetical protein